MKYQNMLNIYYKVNIVCKIFNVKMLHFNNEYQYQIFYLNYKIIVCKDLYQFH